MSPSPGRPDKLDVLMDATFKWSVLAVATMARVPTARWAVLAVVLFMAPFAPALFRWGDKH